MTIILGMSIPVHARQVDSVTELPSQERIVKNTSPLVLNVRSRKQSEFKEAPASRAPPYRRPFEQICVKT